MDSRRKPWLHEADLVSYISSALADATGPRRRDVPALPVPMAGAVGEEGRVNQYTEYGQRLIEHLRLIEQLDQSAVAAASAERRARSWKRRCLALSILLGAALFVIEAMIAGRM